MANDAPHARVVHARNLDFGAGLGFTAILRRLLVHVRVVRGAVPLFETQTFGGFVGVLTGMRPHAFSLSINTRFQSAVSRQSKEQEQKIEIKCVIFFFVQL